MALRQYSDGTYEAQAPRVFSSGSARDTMEERSQGQRMSGISRSDQRSDNEIAIDSLSRQNELIKEGRLAGESYKKRQEELMASELYRKSFDMNGFQYTSPDGTAAENKAAALKFMEEGASREQAKSARVNSVVDSEKGLADKFRQIASGMLSVNPTTAMEWYKKADEADARVASASATALKMTQEKMQVVQDMSVGIKDQASLDEAIPSINGAGFSIPDKYKVWNVETEAYWKNQAIRSKSFMDMQKIEHTERSLAQRDKEFGLEQDKFKAKQQKQTKDDTLSREKIIVARRNSQNTKGAMKNVKTEIAIMSESSEKFSDMNGEFQTAAAQDIITLTDDIFAKEPELGLDGAKAKAQTIVKSRIGDDGTYNVVVGEANQYTKDNPLVPKTQADIDNLPSGSWIKDPTTGRILRKK